MFPESADRHLGGSAYLAPEMPTTLSPRLALSLLEPVLAESYDSEIFSLPYHLRFWAAALALQAAPLVFSCVASRGLSKRLDSVVPIEMRSSIAQHDRIKDAARRL